MKLLASCTVGKKKARINYAKIDAKIITENKVNSDTITPSQQQDKTFMSTFMTETLDAKITLHDFLPYRLFVLANRISSSLAQHYEEQFEISRAQWRVLAVLGEKEALSAAEVASMTTMDKVAVSRAVVKLVDAGLVQRKFSSEDRRRSVLKMSASGKRLYSKIVPIALQHEKRILDQLSDKEIQLLKNMLAKLDKLSFDF